MHFLGFNKDEGSMFIYSMIPFLTEEMIEEDPYGSFVASATYIAVGARVSIFSSLQATLFVS